MAQSFSVRAILSAQDKGFTSTLKEALGTTEKLSDKIKSGFAFGVLTGMGQQAFSMLTNGAKDMVGEINDASKAWQTFEGNMSQFGKSSKEIAKVQKELQSYAETTVYGASDMASTYAQLEAVGVGGMKKLKKGTSGLVKGFGGLAAASEDPKQAMKSLSQQATQMAAKPLVAWEDFKIMLEQSPAGMAAVAKAMGVSTEQLISKIQAGEVKTQDFFAAIEKAGTSEGFQKMATEAKTMDMALDGAKEALGNKLLPAFQVLSKVGIKAIDGIADKIGKLDADKIATKISSGIEAAKPYWESFKDVLSQAGEAIKSVGEFLKEHEGAIKKYAPKVLKLVLAFKAFQLIGGLIPGMSLFASALTGLAGKGVSAIASKLFGISKAEKVVGKTSGANAKQMMAAAKSFLLMATAVLVISVGFALLAQSAIALAGAGGPAIAVMFGLIAAVALLGSGMVLMIKTLAPMAKKMQPISTAMLKMGVAVLLVAAGLAVMAVASIALANAGTPAILCMVGMVAAIALLAYGAATLAPALAVGAAGLTAFGVAVLAVGAGVLLACMGMAILAQHLPTIASYGLQTAAAFTLMGTGLIIFAAGAILAGASMLVLSAGFVALGVAVVAGSVGIAAFGVAMAAAAVGVVAMVAGLKAVNSTMKSISKNAKSTKKSLSGMQNSVKTVSAGLDALGNKAKGAINKLTSAFNSGASKSKSAGTKVGNSFTKALTSKLRAGRSGTYSAGAYVSKGFADGMRSKLGTIRTAAAEMAKAAEKALKAEAKIHSPSRVTAALGGYFGEGFVNGVLDMVRDARLAAERLVNVPSLSEPRLAFAGAYGGELSADYDYTRSAEYSITVVSTLDGREVARNTANYMQDELDRNTTRTNRKHGRR
jgi:tape measure domain-containing protein